MKFLKGLGIFFLSLFAFVFVLLLSLSLITKNVIQKGVVGSVIKNVIIEEFATDEELTKKDKENIEKINKVVKTDDINELVSKLLDEYGEKFEDEDHTVSDETIDYIIDLLVDYKDLVNDISGEKVTEKQIRSKNTREGIESALNEILDETPENTELALKITIRSYSLFISNTFRILMGFFIIVCFVLIGLIKKSFITWMKPAAIVLIFTGLIVSAMYFGLQYAIGEINHAADYEFIINATPIIIIGISEIVLGIVLRIITLVTSSDSRKE
jgi:hypothetical protein